MRILLACEKNQLVAKEFRKLGHEAFSCDLQECTGGHPEWHLCCDIMQVINPLNFFFNAQNGDLVHIKKWDMMIAFPPCTYLTVTANKWLKDQPQPKSGALVGQARRDAMQEAIEFFKRLWNCGIPKIAMENPVGVINTQFMKPTQIIQPYFFGDEARKTTCLWLKNLPPLYHNKIPNLFDQTITHVGEGESIEWISKKTGKLKRQPKWYAQAYHGKDLETRQNERSITFPGIAKAMAEQWGYL